jgi:serine/threonine protein kinase
MIGRIIQNYRIVSKIGEGGMGIVYLGEHITIRRKAAVKFLNPLFLQNTIVRDKFINEAQTLAELQHPNIVMLYDFGTIDNNIFLLMEYLEGVSLDKVISSDKPNLEEHIVKNILFGVLNGVSYAHKKKIVHRDIKPSNIIISKDGVPKILDFGIAKILTTEAQKTASRMGSIAYMSPEQVLHKTIDERTDIYSLGVTIYEMLTNMSPYRGEASEFFIYDKIVKEDFPSPRMINPDISEHIESIVMKATEKNPDNRFQSCDELTIALYDTNFRYNRKINYHVTNAPVGTSSKTEIISPSPQVLPSPTAFTSESKSSVQPEPPEKTSSTSAVSEFRNDISIKSTDNNSKTISKIRNPYLEDSEKEKISTPVRNPKTDKRRKFRIFPIVTIFVIIIVLSLFYVLILNRGTESVKQETENRDSAKQETTEETMKTDSSMYKVDTTDLSDEKKEKGQTSGESLKTPEQTKTQKKVSKQTKDKTEPKKTERQETNQDKKKPRVRFE